MESKYDEVHSLLKEIRCHAVVAHGHCHVAGYNNDVKMFLNRIKEKSTLVLQLMEEVNAK